MEPFPPSSCDSFQELLATPASVLPKYQLKQSFENPMFTHQQNNKIKDQKDFKQLYYATHVVKNGLYNY